MTRKQEDALEGAGYHLKFKMKADSVVIECSPKRGVPYVTTGLDRRDAVNRAYNALIAPKPVEVKTPVRDPERLEWMRRIQREAGQTLQKWGVKDVNRKD